MMDLTHNTPCKSAEIPNQYGTKKGTSSILNDAGNVTTPNPHGEKKAAKKAVRLATLEQVAFEKNRVDEQFMKKALECAKRALEKDEVPVGAVVVCDGRVIASGFNLRESKQDATLHAELIAIRRACQKLKRFRLDDCTLYVTLEPCPMCAGGIVNARLPRVVFGASDLKAGCCGSILDIPGGGAFNHRAEVTGGVLEKECGKLISDYFREKRLQKTKAKVEINNFIPPFV